MYKSTQSQILEIDGLRAFAVVVVLLFHGYPKWFSGGFIGVDIFFTISGYVIARTYLHRLVNGDTKLSYFFLKRVRRLAPAYIVVLLSSTIIALLLFDPVRLKSFAISLVAQPLYIQNVTFWLEGDYFHRALTKPLLHTWSLAVEEQFYFLFGMIIILLRWRKKLLWPVLVASFSLSLLGGYALLILSPKTSFYLTPFRVWEFSAGILVYLVARRIKEREANKREHLLAVVSILGLLISSLGFDETIGFPGYQSILSTVSVSVLLLIFETRPSRFFTVFRIPPVRRIGELSYSLYLWHWPLIVFASHVVDRQLRWFEALIVLITSYVLSDVTYRVIEDPVRRKQKLGTTPELIRIWGVASLILAIIGTSLFATKGATFFYTEPLRSLYIAAQEKTPYRCSKFWRIQNPADEFCPINDAADNGNAGVLILGDSHADMLDELIGKEGDKIGTGVYLTTRNCDLNEYGTRKHCSADVLDDVLEQAQKVGIKRILAISMWQPHGASLKDGFETSVEKILSFNLDLFISEMIPIDESFNPLNRAVVLKNNMDSKFQSYTFSDYLNSHQEELRFFRQLENKYYSQITVLRPSKLLCTNGICEFETNGYPNYFDSAHLTHVGGERVLPLYRSALIF